MNDQGTLDYFSVLVVGENPDEQMSKFDSMEDVKKPYILYKYSDSKKIRKSKIKFYEEFIKKEMNLKNKDALTDKLKEIKSLTDEQYFIKLGEYYTFDKNKNIISTENPNGKWLTCEKGGRIFSCYMLDRNGNGIISGKKEDIEWNLIHLNKRKVDIHNRTWELCVNNAGPETESDRNIINNMKSHKNYFTFFKNKNEYINMSCSFWTYAVCNNGEWIDMENYDEYDWISNYYKKIIGSISNGELITIYECTK
jgi:hypothetical protein